MTFHSRILFDSPVSPPNDGVHNNETLQSLDIGEAHICLGLDSQISAATSDLPVVEVDHQYYSSLLSHGLNMSVNDQVTVTIEEEDPLESVSATQPKPRQRSKSTERDQLGLMLETQIEIKNELRELVKTHKLAIDLFRKYLLKD